MIACITPLDCNGSLQGLFCLQGCQQLCVQLYCKCERAAAGLTAAAMVALIFAAAEAVAAEAVAAAAGSMAAAGGTNGSTEGANTPHDVEDLRQMTSYIVPFTIVAFIFTLAQRFFK